MRLKERVAIITGGGGGIGEATALRFAEEGAKLVINDVREEHAAAVAEKIKSKGGQAIVINVNVSKKSEVDALVQQTLKEFGKLDILVNNAGITRDSFTKKMTEEQWDAVIEVNLKGTWLCSQSAYFPMAEQKYGKINNTSSIGALGNMGQANYTASKCGIMGLTKTLALEFARDKINVNCVAPGGTRTPIIESIPEEVMKMMIEKIPFRRFAEPREIADAHVFLASEEANYITGQVLFVDGGTSVGF